jgi:hypothetical protein
VLGITPEQLTACGKSPQTVEACALLCFWAHRKFEISTIQVERKLQISQPATSRLSKRGERIVKENQFNLIEKINHRMSKYFTTQTQGRQIVRYHLKRNLVDYNSHRKKRIAMAQIIMSDVAL